jgi:23S rRNA (cytidine2498-2'-O)-methyltransferase
VKKRMDEVTREDAGQAQWLLMDVNLAPQVALRSAARVAALVKSSLCGVVLTLKLNEWSFLEQTERFLDDVRAMGVVNPRARQLPAHRQEIVIAGITARGEAR